MRVFIKGLNACGMRKTNVRQYEDILVANGHTLSDDPADCDTILLWTCGFRKDFRDNSLAEIDRYRKEYSADVVVAGCLPDIDREMLKERFGGAVIAWKEDEAALKEYFGLGRIGKKDVAVRIGESLVYEDIEKYKKEYPDRDASFIDQFNKLFVAEGCRFECSYCSERLAFPPYHSYSLEQIESACRQLIAETGCLQFMLLGDSIGDYGHDIGSSLPELIRRLLSVHSCLKIGLQGFNPAHFIKFFDDMEEFIGAGAIRHMQLPIQSASERILKLMKRPYCREDIDRVFGFLNEAGFTEFDTHLIIGFPGETEDDFEETIRFILRHRPKYVLVSGFMESPSMEASGLLGKVDPETRGWRIREAAIRIKDAGIICNTDDSDLSRDRCRRINLISTATEKKDGKTGRPKDRAC